MKICMTVMSEPQSDPRVWKEVISLSKEGYEISIIGMSPKLKTQNSKLKNIKILIVPEKKNVIGYFFFALPRAISLKADIYHSHDLNTLLVGFIASKFNKSTLIYDSHELCVEMSSGFKKIIWRLMESFLIRGVNYTITVNESIASELSHRYKIKKPLVIMNCAPHLNSPTPKLSNSQPIILYEGAYMKDRNLTNIIKSAMYIKKGVIIFIGSGEIEQELKSLTKKLGVEKKIRFVEKVSYKDIMKFIYKCDIGLSIYPKTSLNNYYATPNKLFEYISAGIPVIGSNFPEMKRIIEGNNIGIVVNPDSSEEIGEAINRITSDKKLYEDMKKNIEKVKKIYNWENEVKKLIGLYKNIR